MLDTNHAIQLYRTSATSKSVGINVTNNTNIGEAILYVNGYTYIYGNLAVTGSGSRYKYVSFYQSSGSNVGYIRYDSGNATNVTTGRFRFQQYSGNATATTSASTYYESFSLPTTSQGLTASADYVILTNKTAVTIAQGGTGATTAADARTNLDITPANIGAATSSHNHDITTLTNYSARVYDATVSRTKNTVLAAPNGSAGAASFRALVVADLPTGTTSSTVSLGNHTHSYAGSSSAGGAASSSIKFQAYEGTSSSNRLTTADQDPGNGYCIWFHATSSMTTNKPYSDGHILHFAWDNSSPSWASQLFISDGKDNLGAGVRGRNASAWGAWQPLVVCAKINNTSYWGISINGSESGYIRMPSDGILPYTSGGEGSGHSYIGTSSWRFANAYVDNYYGTWSGNAITVAKGGTGATSAAAARANLDIVTTSPYTGISTTEVAITAEVGTYSAFIAAGVPGSSATSTCFIPKSTITSTAQEWQLTDEAHYIVFSLRISGSTLYAKVLRTNNGTKTISIAGLRGA